MVVDWRKTGSGASRRADMTMDATRTPTTSHQKNMMRFLCLGRTVCWVSTTAVVPVERIEDRCAKLPDQKSTRGAVPREIE